MVAEISDIARNMMISIDIVPKATEDALRQAQNKLLSVESNITRWQHRQTQNANFSALIPFDLEQQRQESREFLSDLTARDQRMMFVVLTIVHLADSKEQLDQDTESILSVARKDMCQVSPLSYQQLGRTSNGAAHWRPANPCSAHHDDRSHQRSHALPLPGAIRP